MITMIFDWLLLWVLISSPLLVAAILAGIWEAIEERIQNDRTRN